MWDPSGSPEPCEISISFLLQTFCSATSEPYGITGLILLRGLPIEATPSLSAACFCRLVVASSLNELTFASLFSCSSTWDEGFSDEKSDKDVIASATNLCLSEFSMMLYFEL